MLKLLEGATIVDRSPAERYAVREADPAEYATVHDVEEDAFLEWSLRERQPCDDVHAVVVGRPGVEPWQVRVVTDPHRRPSPAPVATC